jgi:hypothetical protein
VRRSVVLLVVVSATNTINLSAQSMMSIGFASTLGGNWQIEAAEIGFLHRTGLGPLGSVGASLRAGWFGDQAAIIGGSRGFVGGLAVSARSPRLRVADIGQEMNPTLLGLDVTLEVAGYLASNSPIPEGTRWMSVAMLPGLWIGQPGSSQFGVVVGPAWFAGDVHRVHAFLGLRIEVPLARRRGGP